jgi:protein SCO1
MNTLITKRSAIKKIATRAGFIWASGLFLINLSACSEQKPAFKAVDVTGADYARDFAGLVDHNGQARSVKDFAGKVVVVFFGFVQCPDVCPTTMAELADAKKLLGKDGDKLQAIFITVDPERDTLPILKAYMSNFDASFLALRGDAQPLSDVAKAFKIYYKKVPGKTPSSYTMDHSAGSYVFDTQGRVRLYTRYGSGAKALADDMKLLLQEKT